MCSQKNQQYGIFTNLIIQVTLINRLIPISILILLGVLSAALYQRNIINLSFDTGDAPVSYGLAKHKNPHQGPYFGNKRGDNDRKTNFSYFDDSFSNADDTRSGDDEDAFSNNFTNQPNSTATTTFIADVDLVNNFYVLEVTVSGAGEGDPVRGWIDFNGNGRFDDFEKASAEYHTNDKKVSLAWRLSDTLQPALTFARIRTCKKIYSESIEEPATDVTTGEVEDYAVRIVKPQQISTEQRKFIDFVTYCGSDSINSFIPAINGLRIGDVTASVFVKGTIPDLFGINNIHEASLCGLRLGHDSLDVPYKKPIITSVVFAKPLKKVSCKIIDIDGGDRVKIMGFYKGTKVTFKIHNLSDNFYYQFNATTGEIYCNPNTDAGNDSFIPSSLDMAIQVSFEGLVDNIQLLYSDDLPNSSGSYTLAAISARNADYPELNIEQTAAEEKEKNGIVSWRLQNKNSVAEFIIEKSVDGKTFEAIGKVDPAGQQGNHFSFSDTALLLNTRSCYYRIKAIELDNYIHYSETVRLKRSLAESLTGFYFVNQVFSNKLDLVFTTTVEKKGVFRLLDYKGIVIRTMLLDSIQKGDTLSIHNLEHLPENSYYGEVSTPNSKYVVEAFKIINNQ
jgi:GEVED domain